MSNYFQNFPTISHIGIPGVDITRRFKIFDTLLTDPYAMDTYTVKQYEKPEDVAYYYYGEETLSWLVLAANNIVDPFSQWPMEENQLESFLISKYETRYKEWLYDVYPERFDDLRSDLQLIFSLYVSNTDSSWENIALSFAGQTQKDPTDLKPFFDLITQPNISDINDSGNINELDYNELVAKEKWDGVYYDILLQLYIPPQRNRVILDYCKDQSINHNIVYYEGRFPGELEPIVFNNPTYQSNEYAEEGAIPFGYTAPLDADWDVFRIYEYESILNENRRSIQLIRPEAVPLIKKEMKDIFRL